MGDRGQVSPRKEKKKKDEEEGEEKVKEKMAI